MADHYSRLYRYRQSASRSPLEDFLTEALADLLSRCDTDIAKNFITNVLVGDSGMKKEWLAICGGFNELSFNTQIRINDGLNRLDLLIKSNGYSIFVVECKVRAQVRIYKRTEHLGDETEVIEAELENQLTRYGNWLAAKPKLSGWRGGLVLLSHFVHAPPDFLAPDALRYGQIWRSSASWASAYQWLITSCDHKKFGDRLSKEWRDLAYDLAKFLKEENMSVEGLTSKDFAAAQIFVDSSSRFDNVFEVIYTTLNEQLKKLKYGQRDYWDFHSEGKVIWEWVYLNADYQPKNAEWYISWGIRYPEGSKFWIDPQPPLPVVEHAFVNLGTDGKNGIPLDKLSRDKLPNGWSIAHSEGEGDTLELMIGRSLIDFLQQPEYFAESFAAWVKERVIELEKFLPTLRKFT